MKIEDLYLELGKAMTDKVHEARKASDDEKVMQAEMAELNQRLYAQRDRAKVKQERLQQHIDELQEAIKLASEGIDPCLAKLTAKESLEERRQAQKVADQLMGQTVRINTSLPNTYYTGANVTVPVNAAANAAGAACYAPYFGHPVSVSKTV